MYLYILFLSLQIVAWNSLVSGVHWVTPACCKMVACQWIMNVCYTFVLYLAFCFYRWLSGTFGFNQTCNVIRRKSALLPLGILPSTHGTIIHLQVVTWQLLWPQFVRVKESSLNEMVKKLEDGFPCLPYHFSFVHSRWLLGAELPIFSV